MFALAYTYTIESQADGSRRVLISQGGYLAYTARFRTLGDAKVFGEQFVYSAAFRKALRDERTSPARVRV